jgi:LPXTG-motif cell wall-anchored protein
VSTKTKFATALAALAFGLTVSGGVAYATSRPDGPYVGEVTAGGPCTAEQAKAKAWGKHHDDRYECRATTDANGRPCHLWKYAGPIKGQWTGGPAKCRPACVSPKPAPSTIPSTSASPSASSAPSGSSAAASPPNVATTPILPITGANAWLLALGGIDLLGAGGALLLLARRLRNS